MKLADAPRPDDLTHRLTDATGWYVHPGQSAPPNGRLRAGLKVRVVQAGAGYSRVWTEDGLRGWVQTPLLEPLQAPASQPAAP